jgi:ABC-type bacteriocin/lantibiotic exporter with double-glycine peptidase domain
MPRAARLQHRRRRRSRQSRAPLQSRLHLVKVTAASARRDVAATVSGKQGNRIVLASVAEAIALVTPSAAVLHWHWHVVAVHAATKKFVVFRDRVAGDRRLPSVALTAQTVNAVLLVVRPSRAPEMKEHNERISSLSSRMNARKRSSSGPG